MTNQAVSQAAIPIRAGALEPNPIDNAAITMAAETVSSTEPIRSVFIVYCFLFDHLCSRRLPARLLRARARYRGGAGRPRPRQSYALLDHAGIYIWHCITLFGAHHRTGVQSEASSDRLNAGAASL